MLESGQWHCTWAHWGQDKMDGILEMKFLKKHFLEWKMWIFVKISLEFFPKGSINNKPALV